MFLLKKARRTYHDYYHLLSGQDFILESIENIDLFFSEHRGLEFVCCDCPNEENMSRVMNFNFLRDTNVNDINPIMKKFIYKMNSVIQKLIRILHVERSTNPRGYQFYKGDQWFSITHNLVEYLISQKSFIYNRFRFTNCTDEMFVQTVVMNSPYRDNVNQNIMRCIDWNRTNGLSPYTYTLEDYEFVKCSRKLFARKFSDNDIQIVKRLYKDITE